MLIVRSPVRISFGGGGTDLPGYYRSHGGAVLSVSINKYFYTILSKRTDGCVQVISSDLRKLETWQDIKRMDVPGSELEVPLAAMKFFDCSVSVDLFLASEIPPGTGLGSSASVCVNVLKTLSTYLRRPMSKYELAETAYFIARETLNKPVGKQDEYATAFGGLNFIRFNADESTHVDHIVLKSEVMDELQDSLMLFFTGSTHSSWEILQEQERQVSKPGAAVDALHGIRQLAVEMRDALKAEDLNAFGSMMHHGWMHKRRVSSKISNSRIDRLYEVALESGALGGKLTGAGGGGFLLLFCRPENQPQVRAAFEQLGLKEMAFRFDMDGATVVVNDPFIDSDAHCGTQWVFTPASKAFTSAG